MALLRRVFIPLSDLDRVVGEKHPGAKLNDRQVALIRELHDDYGVGYKKIARAFNVPVSTVQHICTHYRRGIAAVRVKTRVIQVEP